MLLAIDTSGHQTSIAIFDCSRASNIDIGEPRPLNSAKRIDSENNCQAHSHSASLAVLLREQLRDLDLDIKDLKGIVVGAGPGSFTGLRISFSFAKGLAVAARIPLFALSSLAAAAWQAKDKSELIVALDDARRGEFFFSAFRFKDGLFTQEVQDRIFTLEELRQWIALRTESYLVTANPDLLKVFDKIVLVSDLAHSLGQQILLEKSRPQALKDFSVEMLSDLSPFYVRKVAAMTIEERNSKISP